MPTMQKRCPVCGELYWPDDVCLKCALRAQNGSKTDLEDDEIPTSEYDEQQYDPSQEMIGGQNTGGPPENDGIPEYHPPNVKPLPNDIQDAIRKSLSLDRSSTPEP